MSIKKTKVTIKAIENGKEIDIYSCDWDGDLGEWMVEIGGEVAGAAVDYDNVVMRLER